MLKIPRYPVLEVFSKTATNFYDDTPCARIQGKNMLSERLSACCISDRINKQLLTYNIKHRLTDVRLSKLIMTVLTFRGVSKFSGVNTASDGIFS